MNVTQGSVRLWLQQPWFQERIHQLAEANGKKFDIVELFKTEAVNSLNVLVELRDSTKVAPASRIKSAVEILNRGYGTPTVVLRTEGGPARSEDPVLEAERLEKETSHLLGGRLNGAANFCDQQEN
jgi:rhamnose utilization protein RhaD (predicted bifunctional aldolase and dehydrogenase)